MDRVWQLENETFGHMPGFVFAPITEVVEAAEDPTALHPEIQRQAAHIRTDLDRFSPLEISSLVRHGYCVGRKRAGPAPTFRCRVAGRRPLGSDPGAAHTAPESRRPGGPSHRLRSPQLGAATRGRDEPAAATVDARGCKPRPSARIWSTLLDHRDWATYVYVPLLIPILVLLPYFVVKAYQRSQRMSQLVDSLSQGSRDLQQMSILLETGR